MTSKTIHDVDKDVAVLQKEVHTQFKEVFARIKRLEATYQADNTQGWVLVGGGVE